MEFVHDFVFSCFVIMILTCKISSCSPVPVTATQDSNLVDTKTEKENQDDQMPLKNKISGCYLEMYLIVMSGNKEELSDACKSLFEVTNKCKKENCAEKLFPTSTDLQNELQSLSQLNEIEADYGEVKRDGSKADQLDEKSTMEKKGLKTKIKNSKAKQVEEVPSDDNNEVDDDEAFDTSLDTPFMTSSKDDKEEFLVIPINYLKNELRAVDDDDDENDPQLLNNSPEIAEKENAKSASSILARDDPETVNDGDLTSLEAAISALQDRSHDSNPEADTLSNFEVDMTRLAEDLKNLKSKNIF